MKQPLALVAARFCLLVGAAVCDVRGAELYTEPFRLQFHFSPARNWTNDPNGLVYYKGEYHLFYQYNPFGDTWGHMSWGHAVSPDLVHWQHLPVALAEENGEMIFSGSAVVDWRNSSGLCRNQDAGDTSCLIAIYTGNSDHQSQSIAFSNDRGRTWTKYKGNPVIDLGLRDFRDPKVFRHEADRKWVMVAALPAEHKVRFFGSTDLKRWNVLSDFGSAGATGGAWECPDLFPLAMNGGQTRWVLSVNINPGGIAGGSGNQYFVGRFDGTKFTNDNPASQTLWADYGMDFYASQSYSDIPPADGRRIWLGWFSNWLYAGKEPTRPWRCAQSIPRVLKLKMIRGSIRLVQQPIAELAALRGEAVHLAAADVTAANRRLGEFQSDSYEIDAEFDSGTADEVGFRLRVGGAEQTLAGCDFRKSEGFIDRAKSGTVNFSGDFAGRHAGPLDLLAHRIKLRIFVDRSSVELFANGGETVISDRIFPSPGSTGLQIYERGGSARVVSLDVWKLKSAW
jgi:fructan beta-fructosidase